MRRGDCPLRDVQARPVELWLGTLALAPKSKAHIRGVLSRLWDYAMWRGDVPTQRNPMDLVTIRGATKRKRRPRSLTVEEFRLFAQNLAEPFRTIALLCVCLGLRISECLALRWSDVDWLNGKLRVERGIVCQQVDELKTAESRRHMSIDACLLDVLKAWKYDSVPEQRGLDVCLSGAAWAASLVIRSGKCVAPCAFIGINPEALARALQLLAPFPNKGRLVD